LGKPTFNCSSNHSRTNQLRCTTGIRDRPANVGEIRLTAAQPPRSVRNCDVETQVLISGKLTGWEVARHAREIIKQIPVVYMTGAGAHDWGSMGVPNSVLLIKPFAPAQVVTAVSQLLSLRNRPGA
jgi:hypothetical protein